jgi:outer membrane protein OmpA-like peptidoglycan-associated protein
MILGQRPHRGLTATKHARDRVIPQIPDIFLDKHEHGDIRSDDLDNSSLLILLRALVELPIQQWIRSPHMKLLHTFFPSPLPLNESGIVRRSSWALAAVALLGLSGCLPAGRGWVREELAVVLVQMAEVRDRVAVVEQKFGRLDPKVDRILVQVEQLASRQTEPGGLTGPAEPPSDHKLVVDGETFAAGMTGLTPAARQAIDAFIRQVPGVRERQVVVVGHTDHTGSDEANYRLGERRAAAVAHYLLGAHGFDPVRVRVTSAGGTRPVADNTTTEGRQQNRRVELVVYRDQVQMPTEIQRQLSRKLTEDQREQLLRTLREDPKVPLAVVSISGDGESYAFAKELDALFNTAGWSSRGVSQETVSGIPPGLTFVTKSGDAVMLARAVRLQNTLHTMGIAAQSRALESMPQGLLMLVVGPQPR